MHSLSLRYKNHACQMICGWPNHACPIHGNMLNISHIFHNFNHFYIEISYETPWFCVGLYVTCWHLWWFCYFGLSQFANADAVSTNGPFLCNSRSTNVWRFGPDCKFCTIAAQVQLQIGLNIQNVGILEVDMRASNLTCRITASGKRICNCRFP